MKIHLILAGLLLLGLIACTQPEPEQPVEGRVYCTDPRPEICTANYEPVCGDNGRTYSNSCAACADSVIVYSDPGGCMGDVDADSGDAVY